MYVHILTFTSSLLVCIVSATREEVGPSLGGLFLEGPDFDLHLQRLLQYRPFPLHGHLGAR